MFKKTLFTRALAVGGLAFTSTAWADDASLQKQVDELTRLVRQLQAQVGRAELPPASPASAGSRDTTASAGRDPVTAEDVESVREQIGDLLERRLRVRNGVGVVLNGSAAVRYVDSHNIPATPFNAAYGGSSFSIPIATVGFTGLLRSEPASEGDVRYALSFNYAGAANTTRVHDAFITVGVKSLSKKELEPAYTLGLQLGQQAVFFGNDNVGGEELRPSINGASYLSAFRTRDIGLVASGGLWWNYDSAATSDTQFVPTLAYTLGVFNGSGVGAVDENYDKALLGKLVYSPFTRYNSFFQGLKLGVSRIQWATGARQTKVNKELHSVSFEWLKLPFLTTAEYVWGRDDPAAPGPDIEKEGFVATVFYRPGKLPDFEPLVRFDRWNYNRNLVENGRRDTTTIGFNYYFWQKDPIVRRTYETVKTERVIKIQVNYLFVRDTALPPDAPSANQFLSQFVIAF